MNDEAKKVIDKISEIEKTVAGKKLAYKAGRYTYSFQNFQTIRTFGKDIYSGEITLKETNLLVEIMNFKKKNKTTGSRKKTGKRKCS